jgi:hypothetical protein
MFPQVNFNVDGYKTFLQQNKNLSSSGLYSMYPAGKFNGKTGATWLNVPYYDSVKVKLNLTNYEKELIAKNGFMASERLSYKTMGEALIDVFNKDLPVFVSSDAILHAFHASYDVVLKETEKYVIIGKLNEFLKGLHAQTSALNAKYALNPAMKDCLKDFDLYLTIALKLLGEPEQPWFSENSQAISDLIALVNAQRAASYKIFGNSGRLIDYSQFKPRGHYDDSNEPILASYFRAAMWLGRIEFYLVAPKALEQTPPADVRRQTADAMLMLEAMDLAGSSSIFSELEDIIGFFVGPQDNVTLPDLKELRNLTGIDKADMLLDSLTHKRFCDTLAKQAYANQKILSQILTHDPMQPDSIVPASAFMPFGQRFVIDSYITGNVVYDRIKPHRMLPSTLDILFALGNNAAGQLLKPDIDKFSYAPNIASLRFLIDSYDQAAWNGSLYNMWLNSLRKLNPPENRTNLPDFMQTSAYWQQKINTQLASWTELRHDNLLYAKQSYSGGVICSYPHSYVEPVTEFYLALKTMAENARDKFKTYSFNTGFGTSTQVADFFNYFAKIADTLGQISQSELSGTPFTERQKYFLESMLYQNHTCGSPYTGWYPNLFYGTNNMLKQDFLVADMHTSPTDEMGNSVGWVKHCGTGPVNMGVWITKLPGVGEVAFSGPVMSYYEYTTTNFFRLTDQEWTDNYLKASSRPDLVNLYLAGSEGNSRGTGPDLTSIQGDDNGGVKVPASYITARNFPNPFNPSTIISFAIPFNLSNQRTTLTIYNIEGQVLKTLVDEVLPSGSYLTKWDGKNENGVNAASGIYIYNIKCGGYICSGKMNLIK